MLQRARAIHSELGTLEGGLYLFSRALDRLSRGHGSLYRYHLFWQPTPKQDLMPPSRKGRVAIRSIKRGDEALERMPRPRSVLERRLRAGNRCLGAFHGEELVGFLWYAEDEYQEDEARCTYRLPADGKAVWDYDVYIDPRRRLSPVFAQLWDDAAARFRKAGVQGTFSRISAFNTASLASQYRLGGKKLGSVTFWKLGPLQVAVSTMKPRIHVGLSSEPIFHLTVPCSEEGSLPEASERGGS